MDPVIGALIGAGAMAGTNVISSALNVRESRRAQRKALDFSSRAHQIEMADLRKAGLNPLLTGKYGGAQTPALPVGKIDAPLEGLARDVTSAIAVKQQKKLMDAQIDTQKEQAALNSASKVKAIAETKAILDENARKENRFPLELDQLIQNVDLGESTSALNRSHISRVNKEIEKLREELYRLKVSGKFWSAAGKLTDEALRILKKIYQVKSPVTDKPSPWSPQETWLYKQLFK